MNDGVPSTPTPIRFLMVMPWGRVGSNLLLNCISQMVGNIEKKIDNEKFNTLKTSAEQLDWFRDFYAKSSAGLAGSKQSIMSVRDPAAFSHLVSDMAVPVIRLRRRNLVRVAISQLRGQLYADMSRAQSGRAIWGVKVGMEPLAPVPLDPSQFVWAVGRAREADERLLAFSPRTRSIDLDYEAIQADAIEPARRVCEWLGLTVARRVEPSFIKATPDDLASAVPNLADLRSALRGSPLAVCDPMFDS